MLHSCRVWVTSCLPSARSPQPQMLSSFPPRPQLVPTPKRTPAGGSGHAAADQQQPAEPRVSCQNWPWGALIFLFCPKPEQQRIHKCLVVGINWMYTELNYCKCWFAGCNWEQVWDFQSKNVTGPGWIGSFSNGLSTISSRSVPLEVSL